MPLLEVRSVGNVSVDAEINRIIKKKYTQPTEIIVEAF